MTASTTFGPLQIGYDDLVLRPRPWTLLQSRWAVEWAARAPSGPMLELCAGAGHIGLAAAMEADRGLVQVELDPHAAEWARRSADVAGRSCDVRCAPMDEALAPDERFPIVLADPPYLPSDEVAAWPADPVRAIDGGPDGLDVIRTCLSVAAVHLAPAGVLLLQVAGAAQAAAVEPLAAALGLRLVEVREHDPQRAVALFSAPA